MNPLSHRLKHFARRVRLVRAWRGFAVGLCVGGVLGISWAAMDLFGIFYTEWLWLGILAVSSALVGAAVGFCLKVSEEALAKSIDRRGGLEDRLITAREHGSDGDLFDEPLVDDAAKNVERLEPRRVFPLRVGKWQAGAAALTAVAAMVFLMGNTPIFLTEEQKKQLDELKKEGAKIERILKENMDDPELEKRMSEEERRLANELLKLKKDLEKNRLTKEEALQRANELAKEADKLMREHIKNTEMSLKDADTALDKLRKQAMEQVGMKQNADTSMMKMSESERNAAIQQAQQEVSNLQNQISSLQSKMDQLNEQLKNPNLSAEERKKLEEQKKALEQQMKEAQDALKNAQDNLEALQLSKEAQEVFKKMMQHPLYKKLQELAQQLAENAEQAEQTGQPKLTREQREQLQRELEELAKQLKDDKAMEEYLQALLDAMKESGGT